jgi:hypothetical protein
MFVKHYLKMNNDAKREEKKLYVHSKIVLVDYKLCVVNTLGKYFSVICNIAFGNQ